MPTMRSYQSRFEPFEPFVAPEPAEAAVSFRLGVIVIGGGIAGWAAVRAIRSLDPRCAYFNGHCMLGRHLPQTRAVTGDRSK